MYEIFGINTKFVSEDTFGEPISSDILKQRDTNGLRSLFKGCQDNWNYRYFYSLAMSRHFPIKKIRNWIEQESNSSDAYLVYGARLLKESWNARGYGRGSEVNEDRWRKFYELLDQTESVLLRAAQTKENETTPRGYTINSGCI